MDRYEFSVQMTNESYNRAINRAYRDGLLKGQGFSPVSAEETTPGALSDATHQTTPVPAERRDLYNGQTAFDHGYRQGLAEGRSNADEEYASGREVGYQVGEIERIALATANTNLRSIIREALYAARAHEPYYAIIEALTAAR